MRYLALLALLALPAHALTVTLSGATTNACTYAQIVTDPAGNLVATCQGTTPTGGGTGTGGTGGGTGGPPAGCPALPAGMLTAAFLDPGVWFAQVQRSGQVVSIPLPKVVHHSGQIAMGENAGAAATPQPVTVEITISKCPGFIDTDTANPGATHPNGNACNLKSPNGTYNQVTWFGQPFSTLTDAASANRLGYCWAGEAEGPWYFNARWTYASCPFGQSVCGFAIQQNLGPY